MITLDAHTVKELPVDELALTILEDLVRSNEWNEHNYLIGARQGDYSNDGNAVLAISEALTWLRGNGFIARTPGQSNSDAIFVTRAGRETLAGGLSFARASARLQKGLHPLIEARARRQFLLGEHEQAVFVSMKAVEIRVRSLAGFTDEEYGVDLMNKAFGPAGHLTDPTAARGERDGTRALFAGAYAVLRNPSGHRDIDYDDVAEAAEAVTSASLLMRILDRVERRLNHDQAEREAPTDASGD